MGRTTLERDASLAPPAKSAPLPAAGATASDRRQSASQTVRQLTVSEPAGQAPTSPAPASLAATTAQSTGPHPGVPVCSRKSRPLDLHPPCLIDSARKTNCFLRFCVLALSGSMSPQWLQRAKAASNQPQEPWPDFSPLSGQSISYIGFVPTHRGPHFIVLADWFEVVTVFLCVYACVSVHVLGPFLRPFQVDSVAGGRATSSSYLRVSEHLFLCSDTWSVESAGSRGRVGGTATTPFSTASCQHSLASWRYLGRPGSNVPSGAAAQPPANDGTAVVGSEGRPQEQHFR